THGQAGAGDQQQRVFFRRVHGHTKLTGERGIHEFNLYVGRKPREITVAPLLVRVHAGGAAALFYGALLRPAVTHLSFIRGTVFYVDHAAVGLPAGDARSVMLIGVSDTAIVFLAIFVFFGIR